MVDRVETQVRVEEIATRRAVYADCIVSTNDTVTFDNINTITNAYILRKDDGSVVTFTKATNQLTITQAALTNVLVQIMVNGTPA